MAFKAVQLDEYIGKGFTLPIKLTNGKVDLESGVKLIRASIITILSWPYGTRFFLNDFGSKVDELLEEPNDDVLFNIAHTMVVEALKKWEKRIEVLESQFSRDDYGKLTLKITYRIITSQKTDTLVFPFYKTINT